MRCPATNLIATIFASAAISCALGCGQQQGLSVAPPVTADDGAIRLLDLDGNHRELWPSDQEAVTVVVFTRSDCPVSNRYAPEIGRLYEEFHPRSVEFYLVYVDPRETPGAIRAHLDEYVYPCPALRDPVHSLVEFTGATVTPEAVVFDADRKIVYRGRIDNWYDELGKSRPAPTTHDLADAIEATLAGRPVAEPVTKAVGCYIADLK
jgi:hypothetical protein